MLLKEELNKFYTASKPQKILYDTVSSDPWKVALPLIPLQPGNHTQESIRNSSNKTSNNKLRLATDKIYIYIPIQAKSSNTSATQDTGHGNKPNRKSESPIPSQQQICTPN
jgi:hypothetical protein